MKTLQERLQALVGHDFLVNLQHDNEHSNDEYSNVVPPGRLQEIGADYIIISTKAEEEGGFVERGGEWFVLTRDLTTLVHTVTDCAGCAIDAAGAVNGGKQER